MKWVIWERDRYAHHLLPVAVQHYFEWSAAYHLHSNLWHLAFNRSAYNFYEMLLHHFVTLSLLTFCYLTGHTAIGALVSILHDSTDIPAYAIKLAVNTSSTILSLSVYAFLVVSWLYFRLYCFGYVHCGCRRLGATYGALLYRLFRRSHDPWRHRWALKGSSTSMKFMCDLGMHRTLYYFVGVPVDCSSNFVPLCRVYTALP